MTHPRFQKMLPSFYQACLQAQLSSIQFITLQMLVALLQRERCVSIERLATLFAQPIQFESRRRNLQRFLQLPQLNIKALWFPILKYWLKQHYHRGQRLYLVIDRTQWKHHNLLMVSLVYQKRAIPVFWHSLDHCGSSSFAEQQTVLRPLFALLQHYRAVVLGDREFHSVALADWLRTQAVGFVLRLPKSTTVKSHADAQFERLDELLQYPGIACFEVQVQVTQQQGFGRFNLVTRWKRVYRQFHCQSAVVFVNQPRLPRNCSHQLCQKVLNRTNVSRFQKWRLQPRKLSCHWTTIPGFSPVGRNCLHGRN